MRKLVGGLVVSVVLLLGMLLLFGRYEYVNQSGQALRVDRLTGRTAVLHRSTSGGIDWTNVTTAEDIRQRVAARVERPPLVSSPAAAAVMDCPDQDRYPPGARPEFFKPQCDARGNRVSRFH